MPRASLSSLVTGVPTNTLVRPAALAEPNLLLWLRHFLANTGRERVLHNSEGMRQMGAAITPLVEEMFEDLGLDRTEHNFHYTPGLLLSRCTLLHTLHLLPLHRPLLHHQERGPRGGGGGQACAV